MNHGVLMLAFASLFPAIAQADSWNPWRDQRVVSPSGMYYVVMQRTDGPRVYGEWGPVEYIICQRGAGTPPVKPANSNVVEFGIDEYDKEKGGQLYEIKSNPNVSVRDGDKILGRGTLDRPPLHILISDDGLGFAGLDVYGYNYAYYDAGLKAENAVIMVSSTGKVIHRKRLIDVFTDDQLADFDTSAGGLCWLNNRNPGWINEEKNQLVIVGAASETKPNQYLVRFIDWQTGQITTGPTRNSQDAIKTLKREHFEAHN